MEREKQDKDTQIEAVARSAAEAAKVAKNLAAVQAAAIAESSAAPSSLLHSVPPPPSWRPCQPGKELETVLVRLPLLPGVRDASQPCKSLCIG